MPIDETMVSESSSEEDNPFNGEENINDEEGLSNTHVDRQRDATPQPKVYGRG